MSLVVPKRWARCLTILSVVILHPSLTTAQEKLSMSPVNPAFEQYQAARQKGMVQTMTVGGHPLGYVPAPLNLKHTAGQKLLLSQPLYGLPSSYDLRTNKLTAVRDQGQCGSCWAFGAFASMESCLLTNETWDFSENNLKNNHGFDYGPCSGGNVAMSTAYLTRWSGPATEAVDPYHARDDRPSPSVSPVKHTQEVLFLPQRASATDNNTIKQAVMTYGAVTMAFYMDESPSYYNSGTHAYYYNGTGSSDHEVAIVGWDDSFSTNNFAITPPGNGAFIVKNSWGTGWGEAGYFYISYYDTQVGENDLAVFESAESTTNYDRSYQYDLLGWVSGFGYGDTTAWFANVFTALGSEQLKAVSFYTASVNSSYEVYIYLNPTSSPVAGSPVSTLTGTITYPGYHTLALTTPVALTAGQKFSVVIRLTTPGYNFPIPVEYAKQWYSSGASAAAGQSYVSHDGTSWQDATTEVTNTCNVCIKAFTAVPAQLAVSPTGLNFGSVPIGQTSNLNFYAINAGCQSLTGTATLAVAGPFSVTTGNTYTLASSQTQTVTIAFTTVATGTFTGSVIFASNSGNLTNGVTGIGVCTYALSAPGGTFGVLGGSGSFTVNTPGVCDWTPSTTNGWIHLTTGAGTGTGTVDYTVDGNTIAPSRQGRITVQGQTFTVTQAGNLPPSVNAGADLIVTLPAIASLSGAATDDGVPFGTLAPTWSEVSGPGTVSFGSSNLLSTTAAFSTNGMYVLRLMVSDGALSSNDDVQVRANARPRIVTPPAVSNQVASVDVNGQPVPVVLPGQKITFTAGVTDDDRNPLTCTWYFGDGSTSGWCTPTHVFYTCGPHVVSYVVTDGYAPVTNTLIVSVTCPFTEPVQLAMKSNFAPGALDSATLKASLNLPLGLNVTNRHATLDIGGTDVTFILNPQGLATAASSTLKLTQPKLAKGKKTTSTNTVWQVAATLKGDFDAQWMDDGLTNATVKNVSVTVPVLLLFDSDPPESFYLEKALRYTAKLNKSGTAK
jgi:C1A family cysteine protease